MVGIRRHQEDNKGYGLIVSDEGHRLASVILICWICFPSALLLPTSPFSDGKSVGIAKYAHSLFNKSVFPINGVSHMTGCHVTHANDR